MNKIKSLLVLCSLAVTATLSAQNVNEVRINEVLPTNQNGIVDNFGQRCGWIELMNRSYGTVDLGGCYLSNDPQNPKKYLIPKGDLATKIRPRQLAVFHTSGNASQGTFYVNFVINPGETITLYSNDGKTVIDQVTVPADIAPDQSIGRVHIEGTIDDTEFAVLNPSPYSQNEGLEAETKSQIMAQKDPTGWLVTFTSMSVVFISLIVLFLIFKMIGKAQVKYSEKSKGGNDGKAAAPAAKTPAPKPAKPGTTNPEVAAAIAMALDKECGSEARAAIALALHMYLNSCVHDQESFILTINSNNGTAWNNKADMQLRKPAK